MRNEERGRTQQERPPEQQRPPGQQRPDEPNANVVAPTNIIQKESVDYSEIRKPDAGRSENKKP